MHTLGLRKLTKKLRESGDSKNRKTGVLANQASGMLQRERMLKLQSRGHVTKRMNGLRRGL